MPSLPYEHSIYNWPWKLIGAIWILILAFIIGIFKDSKRADKKAWPNRPDEELEDLKATRH